MLTNSHFQKHLADFESRSTQRLFYALLAFVVPTMLICAFFLLNTADIGPFSIVLGLLPVLGGGAIILFFKKSLKQLNENAGSLREYLENRQAYLPDMKDDLQKILEGEFSIPKGDPKKRTVESEDLDELEDIINRTAANIKGIYIQNQQTSFEMAHSVAKLLETISIQASGSSEQASAVSEITSTMEELARTAAQIAKNADRVAKLADNSDQASIDGFDSVNNVIQSIQKINEKMNHISQKTQVLGNQSKQIGKVLDIIYNIADETHLLALNAAIESVAAGEFGKRFGVVAAEVRRLAEISRDNAESIRAIIEEFRNSIDTTILAIDEGNQMTTSINSSAQEILSQLKSITESVRFTSENAGEISIATQQQKSASDQIVLTLKEITEVTRQQARGLKESSAELETLNSTALNLQLQTQKAVIDSSLSMGFRIKKMAQMAEIFNMDRRSHQVVLDAILKENRVIEFIYIADAAGILFSFQVGNRDYKLPDYLKVGNEDSSREWFSNARNSRRPYISGIYTSSFSREKCFTISIGIFDEEERFVGVLAIDINSKEWNKMTL